jgi:Domain of unknown function (DUF4331)
MRDIPFLLSRAAMIAFALPLLMMSGDQPGIAADHFDPPTRVDATVATNPDIAADLADLYIFQTASSIVVALGFAGPQAANNPAVYDRDVLYNIFLSNTGDKTVPEITLQYRFGQDPNNPNASGVMITGLPGVTGPLMGPAETVLTTPNGIKAMVGLFDDPFNFDAAGLTETRATGRLSIRNDRNRFRGLNTTGIVFEIPTALIRVGNEPIAGWGNSNRIPRGTP